MAHTSREPIGTWPVGLGKVRTGLWYPGEQDFATLLDALASNAAREEMLDVERDATAARPMARVLEQERKLARDRLEHARGELGVFQEGLRAAFARRPQVASFDSADPPQDRQAGALITYLVRTEYAQVRTDELGPEYYVYHVEVDWPRLERLASRLGLNLQKMLSLAEG